MSAPELHVLIVESEAAALETMRRAFEASAPHAELAAARSLAEARQHLERRRPDAVIAALFLPDGRSIELFGLAEGLAPYPVVFLASHQDERAAVQALDAAGLDYVVTSQATLADMPHAVERARREWRRARERQQALEALRHSEERYRRLVENIDLGIALLDARGQVVMANTALGRMLGVPSDQLPGRKWPCFDQALDQLREHRGKRPSSPQERVELETDCRRHDGTPFPVRVRALHAPNMKLEGGGFIIVLDDVTERRELEAQLRQAQKMEAIGRLAGGVAHDFNNVLTVIEGYSDVLLQSLDPWSQAYRDLQEVRKAAARAASLTGQLLAVSRKQVLEPAPVDLNAVVRELSDMLRRVIGEDIQLDTRLDPHLGTVQADPAQLHQVLLNLAVNARDAMPRGGTLTIETANVDVDEDFARRHQDLRPGPHALLTVADTGAGMDAETLGHVFEPFYTTKDAGTGLGLSTVYGIVKQSDGGVWAESEPGEGTAFHICLPLAPQAEAAEEPRQRPARPEPGPPARPAETLLLVDDEPAVRSFACRALRRLGYTVLEAATACQALRLARQHPGAVHLVLADSLLPDCHVGDLVARARQLHPEARVLLMSGQPRQDAVPPGIEALAAGFLQKPFASDELAGAVRQALEGPAEQGPQPPGRA
ncbi:MAG: response regulator [Candidatus Brocadiia bacterium]